MSVCEGASRSSTTGQITCSNPAVQYLTSSEDINAFVKLMHRPCYRTDQIGEWWLKVSWKDT